jgi:hypothetical protein
MPGNLQGKKNVLSPPLTCISYLLPLPDLSYHDLFLSLHASRVRKEATVLHLRVMIDLLLGSESGLQHIPGLRTLSTIKH